MSNAFIEHLNTHSETDWLAAVAELLPCIHEVDRNAVQIWFRFHPLELKRYLDHAENIDDAKHGIAMLGEFSLEGSIDSSHRFLFGHRYWQVVKKKIIAEAADLNDNELSLVELIKKVGIAVAEKLNVERQLVNAIVAVGLATLNQVGMEAFAATDGSGAEPESTMTGSADKIVAERAKDDSQGLFGFLKTINKKFSVRYFDKTDSGKFEIIDNEEISSASARDRSKDWRSRDERCWEGVVPVECTSASCGTCWVGVLGGQEKLTDVHRRERRATKVFGYNQPDEPKPFLRLACQAKADGNVTIVIPPWNAVFGKKVYGNVEEIELEPVTTSAKALREAIASATTEE